MNKAKKVRWTFYEMIMVALAVVFIVPAIVVILNSFKPLGKILTDTFGLPSIISG